MIIAPKLSSINHSIFHKPHNFVGQEFGARLFWVIFFLHETLIGVTLVVFSW